MKKILLFLFLLSTAFSADAQLLGGMKLDPKDFITKKVNGESAQDEVGLLEKAILPNLYLIRQQYRLERKGKTYGKNHKPYYGETYSLGIKVSGGLYVSSAVVEPWVGDDDYARVNIDGKYTPEYFWTYQRQLNDSVYKPVELDFGSSYLAPVNVDKSLWLHQDLQSDFGLVVDNTLGEKCGCMFWAYSTTDVQDSAMVVKLHQDICKISVNSDSTMVPMASKDEGHVIGGVFMVPRYERGGIVKMMLAGIAVKSVQGKWALHVFADNKETERAADDVTDSAVKRRKSEKKAKEHESGSSDPTSTTTRQ